MDARAKARRRAEKKYVRRVVRTSLVALAVLFVAAAIFAARYPAMQLNRARRLIDAGRYAAALEIVERLEDRQAAEELRVRCKYAMAVSAMESGDYESALASFETLGDYEDAPSLTRECKYLQAGVLYGRGEYDAAMKLYLAVPDHPGVGDRMLEVQYAQAGALAASGDAMGAFALYQELGSYGDAAQKAVELAMEITGESDEEAAREALAGLTQDELAAQVAVAAAREGLRPGRLAAGGYHTVGLKSDGTAVAAGRNDFGQCDVGGWSDITQVSAGMFHTVALRKDGTVVTAGSNDQGQRNVGNWTDIVQIACGDYATFGLRADGTVLHCGYLSYGDLDAWRGVTKISAGSYMAAGLYGSGSAYLSHPAGESDRFSGLADIALTTGGAVGLTKSGSAVATFDSFPGWEGVCAVSAGSQCVLGIRLDGSLEAHFFRACDAFDPGAVQNAVCVAAGYGHSAVLDAQGRVYAFGDNEYGQLDVTDWMLD